MSVFIDNSSRLTEMVKNDDLDFAIVTSGGKFSSEIVEKEFAKRKMCLIYPKSMEDNIKSVNDLVKLKFFAYNKESNTFSTIQKTLSNAGINFKYDFFSTSPYVMLKMVKRSLGASVLPLSMVRSDIKSGRVAEFNPTYLLLSRKLSLIYKKERFFGQYSKELLSLLESKGSIN